MIDNIKVIDALTSPKRTIDVMVGHLGKTDINFYSSKDKLKSITINRVCNNNKFYGYGISQKMTIKLVDKDREVNIDTYDRVVFMLCATGDDDYINGSYPGFLVAETERDEKTNELTVICYDEIYYLSSITLNDIGIEPPYSIQELAAQIDTYLRGVDNFGVQSVHLPTSFNDNYIYEDGGNFEGTETIREVFDAIAEATQSIYFINTYGHIEFKRLDIDGEPVHIIDKNNYFDFINKGSRKLTKIMHITELGDNVSAEIPEVQDATQYIRNNPLWETREDIAELVNDALMVVGGLEMAQFECTWRGNYLLEIGDKIAIVSKDGILTTSYYLSSTLEYSGGLKETTDWTFEESEAETADNPTSIGEAIKKTYAKVDKVNAEIEIVVEDTAALKLNNESITASVKKTEADLSNLVNDVSAKMSAEDVQIIVNKAIIEGTEKVETSTGFTFDDNGLKITKSNSEINTIITEDGMKVYRKDDEVLAADNQGVRAEDLYATTFLIIGGRSRFENYNSHRTGCFWIGG